MHCHFPILMDNRLFIAFLVLMFANDLNGFWCFCVAIRPFLLVHMWRVDVAWLIELKMAKDISFSDAVPINWNTIIYMLHVYMFSAIIDSWELHNEVMICNCFIKTNNFSTTGILKLFFLSCLWFVFCFFSFKCYFEQSVPTLSHMPF